MELTKQVMYKELDGHKFRIPAGNEKEKGIKEIMWDVAQHTDWEPETTKLIKEVVKEGDVCIDIGASIGYFTMLLARQAGKTGRVYTFEPTQNQFPYLLDNIRTNGYTDRVLPHMKAAWNKHDLLQMPLVGGNKFTAVTVPVSDVVQEPVDFIKIDIDGSEPWALEGLSGIIERSPNLKMVVEYYPDYIKRAGGDIKIVDKILEQFKLTKFDVDDHYWNYYCEKK